MAIGYLTRARQLVQARQAVNDAAQGPANPAVDLMRQGPTGLGKGGATPMLGQLPGIGLPPGWWGQMPQGAPQMALPPSTPPTMPQGQGADLMALMRAQLAQPGYGLGRFPGAGAMSPAGTFLPPGLGAAGAPQAVAPGSFNGAGLQEILGRLFTPSQVRQP